MTTTPALRRTPLYDIHKSLGAKLVPFAGWEMPVQYPSGILAEHNAVRTGVGIFDVSHMGEFEITGPDRNAFVNRVTCNDVGALEAGQVQYSGILTDQGTFVDDCTVYRFDDKLMIVVNASNIAPAWEHIVAHKGGANVRLKDISDEVGLLAVQGPGTQAAAPAAHRDPARRHRLLPLRGGQDRRGTVLHLPHRLHRRGRLRALLPRARHRPALAGDHRGRRQADRPGRPRFAPAGDGLRALRQRDRRHHHAARGRARLDREAGQGRALHRRPTPSAPRSSAASPAAWSASASRAAGSPGTDIRCRPRAGKWTSSAAAP